jgi:hypothetical protein
MWGTLAWWHCGHMLRLGRFSTQFAARRLRPLALEVFFLGTAMSLVLGSLFSGSAEMSRYSRQSANAERLRVAGLCVGCAQHVERAEP